MSRPSHPARRGLAVALALGLGVWGLYGLGGCGKEEAPPAARPKAGEAEPRAMGTMQDSGLDKPPPGAGGVATEKEALPPPAFRFEDATVESGLNDCMNHSGTGGVKEYLLEAVGPGPAVLDFDNDGHMDLYVPDGDVFGNYDLVHEPDPKEEGKTRPALRPKDPKPTPHRDRLFRNLGGGKFEDVTDRAGVGDDRWSFGALAFDVDADGWTDVFVANYGRCRLWRNKGDGTFEDVAEAMGVAGDPTMWSTCATCGDYDGDGWLDLFVARYADPAVEVERQRKARGLAVGSSVDKIPGRSCKWRELDAYCGPVGLKAQPDTLYRREEGGTYRDVTKETRMVPKAPKYGFTSFFFDYDQDGLADVFIVNDSEENFLWRQSRDAKGGISFEDASERTGVKYGQQQNPQASMGVATADINQDGLLDIFVTNFSHDYNNVYLGHRYPGGVSFKDRGLQLMGQAVFYDLSWGCGWYDFDLDADLDLMVANGHVYKEIDIFEKTGTAYEQYPAVFECLDAKKPKLREVGPKPFKG
ncbi:MAG TPA: VCBS repeat-containing protein, partial [Planctomycetota bacterium]|nr:VCBS repeat-containing protein [Planctomycetota bacterium]